MRNKDTDWQYIVLQADSAQGESSIWSYGLLLGKCVWESERGRHSLYLLEAATGRLAPHTHTE